MPEHGESFFAGENSKGNHNIRDKETRRETGGRNRGERNGEFNFETQVEKESMNVEAIKGKFEKFSTPTREAWIPHRKGNNHARGLDGAHAGGLSKRNTKLSPRDSGCSAGVLVGDFSKKKNTSLSPHDSGRAGRVIESPNQQHDFVTYDAVFKNSGGPYSGPLIANIEKSIREAHWESVARKRKSRDGAPVSPVGDLSIMLAKNNEVGDGADCGAAKQGRLGDVKLEFLMDQDWRRLVSSPANHNDYFELELSRAWEPSYNS